MLNGRVLLWTALALLAFAANSLLCRAALAHTQLDAASFTSIRLLAGAAMLWLLVVLRRTSQTSNCDDKGGTKGRKSDGKTSGNLGSALALFTYAAGFSFGYIQLDTGVGALILFGAVQTSMMGFGLWRGERFGRWQWLGVLLAGSGLIGLLLPGLSAPPLQGALLMLLAGVAWGIYSLRGKGVGDPLQVTAGNFIGSLPFTLLLTLAFSSQLSIDNIGVLYAVLAGAITSGIGYAIWYRVLPVLRASTAATLQLSVPLLAAVGGIVLLQEPLTLRLLLTGSAILTGIALVIVTRQELT